MKQKVYKWAFYLGKQLYSFEIPEKVKENPKSFINSEEGQKHAIWSEKELAK